MNISDLIDQAKARSGIPSDLHFAKHLNVSQGAIWQWKNGKSLPTVENAHRLAEIAGVDPAEVVLEILMKNAEGDSLKATLSRFKRALAAAAGVLPALLVSVYECILCKIDSDSFNKPFSFI